MHTSKLCQPKFNSRSAIFPFSVDVGVVYSNLPTLQYKLYYEPCGCQLPASLCLHLRAFYKPSLSDLTMVLLQLHITQTSQGTGKLQHHAHTLRHRLEVCRWLTPHPRLQALAYPCRWYGRRKPYWVVSQEQRLYRRRLGLLASQCAGSWRKSDRAPRRRRQQRRACSLVGQVTKSRGTEMISPFENLPLRVAFYCSRLDTCLLQTNQHRLY